MAKVQPIAAPPAPRPAQRLVDPCWVPGCAELIEQRGLCHNHNNLARTLVRAGKTTLAALEAAGRIAPKRGSSGKRHGVVTHWFLGEDDPT